jgi:hypothetical protein
MGVKIAPYDGSDITCSRYFSNVCKVFVFRPMRLIFHILSQNRRKHGHFNLHALIS